MITHFDEVQLHTLSCKGVRQIYHEGLGLPLLEESDDEILLALCPHTRLRFQRRQEGIHPVHLAFEVGWSNYPAAVAFVQNLLPIVGETPEPHGLRFYFRDGEGNLLELYAHDHLREDVLQPISPLGVMFLREVGYVPADFPAFFDWATSALGMTSRYPNTGPFASLKSGLTELVLTHPTRDWIPIALKPLPPKITTIFGTPDPRFITQRVAANGFTLIETGRAAEITAHGHHFVVRHTPAFHSVLVSQISNPAAR